MRAEVSVATPTGPFTLVEEEGALVRAFWGAGGGAATALLLEAAAQVAAYIGGRLRRFDLPLRILGSDAQRAACAAMAAIPYGQVRTYGDLARDLGVSAQAMGQLCGANPLPVIVPCHRVVGVAGLGGFSGAGGVETKAWLLRHEGGLLL